MTAEFIGPAVTDRRYTKLRPVIPNREGGTNVHRALGGRGFLVVLGLLVKIDVGLVVVVLQKIRRFVQTDPAGRAGIVDIPDAFDVFGKFVCFIGHAEFLPERPSGEQVFLVDRALRRAVAIQWRQSCETNIERWSARWTYGVGSGLGSMSGA